MDAAPGELRRAESHPPFWGPLLGLLAGTLAIRWAGVDLELAGLLHALGRFSEIREGFLGWVYRYAPWPSLALSIGALLVLLAAPWNGTARRHWRGAAFLVALMALGPGVLVNGILKDYTGRPRPYQLEAFGGKLPFREALELGPPGEGYSFPSGHAATAFYLMAPYFLWWRRRRRLASLALGVGLAWGGCVGFVRMLQGGHFLSDVLWAAGVVYFFAWALWAVLLRPVEPGGAPGSEEASPSIQ
jgi:membrane-associated PAP2 superfamily phosphatase